jgi:hypothetical protein
VDPGRQQPQRAGLTISGSFDRIARMAARICDAPMATLSLVGADGVQFLATEGMDGDRPVVETDPGVRFATATPIIAADGRTVGSLNVLDRQTHDGSTDTQLSLLRDLAALAADLIEIEAGGTDRPDLCQLGGTAGCRNPAETKVADSWGDSAWGCWPHAEEALINVVPVFLAHDSPKGLKAYRARRSAPIPG